MNFFKIIKQKYIFNFGSTKRRFSEIYKTNFWSSNESISGPGSQLSQTETVRKELPRILNKLEIKSLLDIPCGDFHWMKMIDLSQVMYTGADIVSDLININNKAYKSKNISFKVLDLIVDDLPKVDAILVRDCFIHLSEKQIISSIQNIKKSGIKYLITNNFPEFKNNFDIKTGMFRKVNLTDAPYNLTNPIMEIEEIEHFSKIDGKKTIVVYKCSDLNL